MAAFLLSLASVVLYVLAGAFGAYAAMREAERVVRFAKTTFAVAFLAQSAAIGVNSVATSGTIISGPNILMLSAWVLAVVSCVFVARGRASHAYLVFAGPVAAVMIVVSQALSLASPDSGLSNQVYYEWPMLLGHILLIFLASAACAVSAFASAMQLYQQRLMKSRSRQLLQTNMPAVSTLEVVARRSALAGTVLFLAGLLVGSAHFAALFSLMAAAGCAGDIMYLIPRIAYSLVVLCVYVVYLVLSFLLPYVAGTRLRCSLSIVGLALMIVLIAISAG